MNRNNTFAEFFAGIGLMRIGLEQSGWRISYANDIDPKKGKLYCHHFEDSDHFHLEDIHQLKAQDIPTVTLATASFPCTDLSLAGRRKGLAGNQSSAFWGFTELLNSMGSRRPPLVLLENVEGFLNSRKGDDFKQALRALNSLGYDVDSFVIDARHFLPQSRRRLFIVGVQNDPTRNSNIPAETEARPSKLIQFIKDNPSIKWNFRPLPDFPELTLSLKDMIDETPDNSPEWWNQKRTDYLLSQMSERHFQIVEELINKNEYKYLTAFRRVRKGKSMAEVRNDGIAGCLRTPKGGSARQILLKVGIGEVKIRYMSASEYAKLMGAGDFRLTGSNTEKLFGFGDAVAVPVVQWVGENYLNPIVNRLFSQTTLTQSSSYVD